MSLTAAGRPITFGAVAQTMGVGRAVLFRYPSLRLVIRERIAGQPEEIVSAAWSEAALQNWPRQSASPLRDLADEWVTGRVARGELHGRSPAVHMSQLESLVQVHRDRPVTELDRRAIQIWEARNGGLAPVSRRKAACIVSHFCQWLVLEGHLEKDPTLGMAKIKEPRRVPRALPSQDVARLVEACPDPRLAAIVWLMVGCGLRCVEVSQLDLADWDDQKRIIAVRGKGGHERVLPVPPGVFAALHEYVTTDRGWVAGPLILANGSKGAPSGRLSSARISTMLSRLMQSIGVHVKGDGRTAHALRHTCASDVLDRCHDVRIVQQMLGHTSLATTQIYLRRANLDQLRAAMDGRSYGNGMGQP
jgi:integrase/recombinase XerD